MKTSVFSISSREFSNVLIANFFKKTWFYYPLALAVGIYLFFEPGTPVSVAWFLCTFSAGYPLITSLYLLYYAHKKETKLMLQGVQVELGSKNILVNFADDSYWEEPYSALKKIEKRASFLVLYFSKKDFVLLPSTAFANAKDFAAAEKKLQEKIQSNA